MSSARFEFNHIVYLSKRVRLINHGPAAGLGGIVNSFIESSSLHSARISLSTQQEIFIEGNQ